MLMLQSRDIGRHVYRGKRHVNFAGICGTSALYTLAGLVGNKDCRTDVYPEDRDLLVADRGSGEWHGGCAKAAHVQKEDVGIVKLIRALSGRQKLRDVGVVEDGS